MKLNKVISNLLLYGSLLGCFAGSSYATFNSAYADSISGSNLPSDYNQPVQRGNHIVANPDDEMIDATEPAMPGKPIISDNTNEKYNDSDRIEYNQPYNYEVNTISDNSSSNSLSNNSQSSSSSTNNSSSSSSSSSNFSMSSLSSSIKNNKENIHIVKSSPANMNINKNNNSDNSLLNKGVTKISSENNLQVKPTNNINNKITQNNVANNQVASNINNSIKETNKKFDEGTLPETGDKAIAVLSLPIGIILLGAARAIIEKKID